MSSSSDDAARQALIDNSGRIHKVAFIASTSTLFGLATLCTISRFAIRLFSRRRPSFDDWLVLLANAALAVSWGILLQYLETLFVVEALNDSNGAVGLTLEDIQPLLEIPKWNSVFVAMDWLCIFSIKFAFLYFFYGLIWSLSVKLNWWFWIVVVFNVCAWLGATFEDFASCPYAGDAAIQCATNFKHDVSADVTISSNVLDIICDLLVVSIPLLALRYSRMRLIQKLGVAAVLCLSVVMVAIAIIRLVGSLATTKTSNLGTAPIWGTFWQITESCVAVIMASVITIRSVFIQRQPQNAASGPSSNESPLRRVLRKISSNFRRSGGSSSRMKESNPSSSDQTQRTQGSSQNQPRRGFLGTLGLTRPTLSGLGSYRARDTNVSESQLRENIELEPVTETDLRDLDYHHVRRQEVASSGAV